MTGEGDNDGKGAFENATPAPRFTSLRYVSFNPSVV